MRLKTSWIKSKLPFKNLKLKKRVSTLKYSPAITTRTRKRSPQNPPNKTMVMNKKKNKKSNPLQSSLQMNNHPQLENDKSINKTTSFVSKSILNYLIYPPVRKCVDSAFEFLGVDRQMHPLNPFGILYSWLFALSNTSEDLSSRVLPLIELSPLFYVWFKGLVCTEEPSWSYIFWVSREYLWRYFYLLVLSTNCNPFAFNFHNSTFAVFVSFSSSSYRRMEIALISASLIFYLKFSFFSQYISLQCQLEL